MRLIDMDILDILFAAPRIQKSEAEAAAYRRELERMHEKWATMNPPPTKKFLEMKQTKPNPNIVPPQRIKYLGDDCDPETDEYCETTELVGMEDTVIYRYSTRPVPAKIVTTATTTTLEGDGGKVLARLASLPSWYEVPLRHSASENYMQHTGRLVPVVPASTPKSGHGHMTQWERDRIDTMAAQEYLELRTAHLRTNIVPRSWVEDTRLIYGLLVAWVAMANTVMTLLGHQPSGWNRALLIGSGVLGMLVWGYWCKLGVWRER